MQAYIPKRKAWLTIILSVLIVSSLSFGLFSIFNHIQKKRLSDPKFRLVAIAQRSMDGEWLKTAYIAELLNLSLNRPVSLLGFNTKQAERHLLSNPLIKEVHLSKVKPGTLSVDYLLRKPIAFLGDYTNTVLDADGRLFPFHPFFTPKRLPEINLGAIAFDHFADFTKDPRRLWGQKLGGLRFEMAMELYHHLHRVLDSEKTFIKRIDISKAYALSYGERQIVITLEEQIFQQKQFIVQQRLLRLSQTKWKQELARYIILRDYLAAKAEEDPLESKPMVIDLRVPRIALMRR